MSNQLQQLRSLGQSVWLDYISRDLLASGELGRLVDIGLGGVTSNPSIFEKAFADSAAYDAESWPWPGPPTTSRRSTKV